LITASLRLTVEWGDDLSLFLFTEFFGVSVFMSFYNIRTSEQREERRYEIRREGWIR
jgi:hypothetical protein